jgi:hypothetical protein
MTRVSHIGCSFQLLGRSPTRAQRLLCPCGRRPTTSALDVLLRITQPARRHYASGLRWGSRRSTGADGFAGSARSATGTHTRRADRQRHGRAVRVRLLYSGSTVKETAHIIELPRPQDPEGRPPPGPHVQCRRQPLQRRRRPDRSPLFMCFARAPVGGRQRPRKCFGSWLGNRHSGWCDGSLWRRRRLPGGADRIDRSLPLWRNMPNRRRSTWRLAAPQKHSPEIHRARQLWWRPRGRRAGSLRPKAGRHLLSHHVLCC